MRYGVNVPNFGPRTDPGLLRDWARTIEGLGYDQLLMSDHLVITPDVAKQYPAPFYEPLTTLSWLAGLTTRVTLGTTVLVAAYRHPLAVARMVANLSDLSNGRFILGVGVGWARDEFTQLGLDYATRGRAADDLIHTLRKTWDDAGHDYRGGHVPIWVGGNSIRARRRAITHADAWHPINLTTDDFLNKLMTTRSLALATQRPCPAFAPRIRLRLDQREDSSPHRLAGTGSPEQVLADIDALEAAGAESIIFDPVDEDPARRRPPETTWEELDRLIASIHASHLEQAESAAT